MLLRWKSQLTRCSAPDVFLAHGTSQRSHHAFVGHHGRRCPRRLAACRGALPLLRRFDLPAAGYLHAPEPKARPGRHAPWSIPSPLYRIEGEPSRRGDGLYDRMRSVGAHEVLVENPATTATCGKPTTRRSSNFCRLAAQRIKDLKGDGRIKYISIFKNYGVNAGQEFEHPNFQLTATTFVPRRVLYELRAGRDYYQQKERCVFCDIIGTGRTPGLARGRSCAAITLLSVPTPRASLTKPGSCPASTNLPSSAPVSHEPAALRELGVLLRRTLQRIRTITEEFHWSCTHRPTACTAQKAWAIGRRSTRITTGTSRSCRSSRRRRSPTLSKRSTTRRSASETAVKRLRDAKIDSEDSNACIPVCPVVDIVTRPYPGGTKNTRCSGSRRDLETLRPHASCRYLQLAQSSSKQQVLWQKLDATIHEVDRNLDGVTGACRRRFDLRAHAAGAAR